MKSSLSVALSGTLLFLIVSSTRGAPPATSATPNYFGIAAARTAESSSNSAPLTAAQSLVSYEWLFINIGGHQYKFIFHSDGTTTCEGNNAGSWKVTGPQSFQIQNAPGAPKVEDLNFNTDFTTFISTDDFKGHHRNGYRLGPIVTVAASGTSEPVPLPEKASLTPTPLVVPAPKSTAPPVPASSVVNLTAKQTPDPVKPNLTSTWSVKLVETPLHLGDNVFKAMRHAEPDMARYSGHFDFPSHIKLNFLTPIIVTIEVGGLYPPNTREFKAGDYKTRLFINGKEVAVLNTLLQARNANNSPSSIETLHVQVPSDFVRSGSNDIEIVPGAGGANLDDFELRRLVIGSNREW